VDQLSEGGSEVAADLLQGRCRLKVLVLDEDICYPPDSGKRIRTWNLLSRLAMRHSISYLCYGRSDHPGVAELESKGIRVRTVHPLAQLQGWPLYFRLLANLFSAYPYSVTKHFSWQFDENLRQLLREERFDLVHCEGTRCARFLASVHHLPCVLGAHNIESQIWSRRSRQSRRSIEQLFFRGQEIKMRWFERRALMQAECATAVTRQDAQQMKKWGVSAVALVPNGVDLEAYQLPTDAARHSELLFLASLDWYPNIDALEYFLAEILPLILSLHPDALLRVVGRRPSESLRRLVARHRSVELIGEVADVRPHLARAGVVVVPLRIGGGSRLKILEALAAGKAVISTSIGAEGLELTAGEHFQLADTPSQFARRTAALISSEEERRRLGENGRRFVSKHYGWDGIAAKLESAWFKAFSGVPLGDSDLVSDNRAGGSVSPPSILHARGSNFVDGPAHAHARNP
jgi:polysaccharide biosynthesis protein PslH